MTVGSGAAELIVPEAELASASVHTDAALPSHLFAFHSSGWALWRWICLRGAGFPKDLIDNLVASRTALLAEQLLECENELDLCRKELLEAIRRQSKTAFGSAQNRLKRMLKQVGEGRIPQSLDGISGTECEKFLSVLKIKTESLAVFEKSFQAEVEEISQRIAAVGHENNFRQAILLQNPAAARRVSQTLSTNLQNATHRGSKDRRDEQLIASYIQRYCMKNDSIGYFGPVGWAKAVDDVPTMVVNPGPELVASSTIYFEHWGIQALANKIAAEKAVKPWLAPRLLPGFHFDGTGLFVAGRRLALPQAQAAVLSRCTGEKLAQTIAEELTHPVGSGFSSESDVYMVLDRLVAEGVLAWTIEVPLDVHPERHLRKLLDRIEDQEIRDSALNDLKDLEQARDSVAAAMGDPSCLDGVLQDLDNTFRRVASADTTRSAGRMYAARTLIYQDCRRDVDVQIGPDLLHNLAEPLSLLLTSARWFTYRAAELYRSAMKQIYLNLAARTQDGIVDMTQFWMEAQGLLLDPPKRLFNSIVPLYQQTWQDILQTDEGRRTMEYRSHDLRGRVETEFAAPHAGWELARYHSPDVMIIAPGVDGIQRGDYSFVLGEVHMAVNTVRGFFAIEQHPCPEEMMRAMECDLPDPRVVPVPPLSWPKTTIRSAFALISSRDYHLEITNDSYSSAKRSQTLPMAAFVLENTPEGIIVRTRDGWLKFGLLEFFGEALSSEVVDYMKLLSRRPHIPRVTIDRLVIARETWSFDAADLKFALAASEAGRFLGARRWAHEYDLPRYVFCRVAVEEKPFFLDFDSPVYVEILCKLVRSVLASDQPDHSVVVSEMLPRPDQLWLPDSAGQRYTSEFRMIMFDLRQKNGDDQHRHRPFS